MSEQNYKDLCGKLREKGLLNDFSKSLALNKNASVIVNTDGLPELQDIDQFEKGQEKINPIELRKFKSASCPSGESMFWSRFSNSNKFKPLTVS